MARLPAAGRPGRVPAGSGRCQAFPSKNIIPEHNRFLDMVDQVTFEGENDPQPSIRDFPHFATQMLGWEPADIVGTVEGGPVPDSLEVTLTEYNETLRPSYAVPEFDKSPNGDRKWLMLIQRLKLGLNLDYTPETDGKDHGWQASPQARFERLLRETLVPIGLLSNGTHLRLVYAPRGETSGHLTFPVQAMTEVAGRPIFAALQMLLSAERLFTLPDKQRLPNILSESRKYQNLVSTKLAEQVLAALYELLRGFQAADDQRHGELLRDVLKDDPNQVYAGMLRVLMRLVFILYAEDRSLLSNDEVYQKYRAAASRCEFRVDWGPVSEYALMLLYSPTSRLMLLYSPTSRWFSRFLSYGVAHGQSRIGFFSATLPGPSGPASGADPKTSVDQHRLHGRLWRSFRCQLVRCNS